MYPLLSTRIYNLKLIQRILHLNLDVTPYVPLWILSFGPQDKKVELTIVASNNNNSYKLLDSLEYDNRPFENLSLSIELYTITNHNTYSCGTWMTSLVDEIFPILHSTFFPQYFLILLSIISLR